MFAWRICDMAVPVDEVEERWRWRDRFSWLLNLVEGNGDGNLMMLVGSWESGDGKRQVPAMATGGS
jgi:hypothetical protein